MMNKLFKDDSYFKLLNEIKEKVLSAQIKAAISVNKELLNLYWDIGKIIYEKQKASSWGDSIIDILSKDLIKEFPNMKGFSRTNLFNIRQWYLFYSGSEKKVQQLVGQLPGGHNVIILNKIIAEYSLKNINKPIGVSAHKFSKAIPAKLKSSLPSIKDIEREFSKK
jgi:predicted nuclease of restriction endonuclease-like (RecB) superfamily